MASWLRIAVEWMTTRFVPAQPKHRGTTVTKVLLVPCFKHAKKPGEPCHMVGYVDPVAGVCQSRWTAYEDTFQEQP